MTTFDDIEISNYDGSPVTLYEFQRTSGGNEFYWRYCNTDADFTYNTNTFTATAVSDDGYRQNGESASSQLVVSMPVTDEFPQMFRRDGTTPSDSVWLTVYKLHNGYTDAAVIWVGTVASLSQVDDIKAQITCNVLTASFRRGGLRLGYSRTCPHALYDSQCRADPTAFDVFGPLTAFTNNTVSADEFAAVPDLYFDGGYIEWTTDTGFVERRSVKLSVGDTLTIVGTTLGLVVGTVVRAVAGCDHTSPTCLNKFRNLANYGGFSNMPGKSPFTLDPVF